MTGWNDKRVGLLRKYWAQGLSHANIAEEMGGFKHCADKGRCSVGTKVMRLREAAKKRGDADEVKFWTRGRGTGQNARVERKKERPAGEYADRPIPKGLVQAFIDAIPGPAPAAFPTDAEVRLAAEREMCRAADALKRAGE
ncbi:MAG TPA: GcrA family cell cycle regulator [Candidatus Paceibacterota bacterium]